MARSAILGNGKLTVGLDERGNVHDFYWPYVGLENLTTARSLHHKIGVWVDGKFCWTDTAEWETSVELSSDALIATSNMKHTELGVTITSEDFVDPEYDTFCRKMIIKNQSDMPKEVRLFMHQVFQISSNGRADTAIYEPDGNYILDYKGRVCLLISGSNNSKPFDQYAVGNYGIEGKQGTFMDAEDGELSGHSIEHAGVDSVLGFFNRLEPGEHANIDYWIIAGDSQFYCDDINDVMLQGLDQRKKYTQQYWDNWLKTSDRRLSEVKGKEVFLVRKSLMTIKAHTDAHGGVIASCDSSIYNYGRDYYSYVWPRDGAFAMWPLIRLGYKEEPKAFFRFCSDILTKDGFLMHKYQPDRAIGSTWHPLLHGKRRELAIQEDETALIIVMIGEYFDYSQDSDFTKQIYTSFVARAADFLCSYIDAETSLPHASYDLWEEKFLTTTYTSSVVYAALCVASELAEAFGTTQQSERWGSVAKGLLENMEVFIGPDDAGLRKGFLLEENGSLTFDNTADISSLYGMMTFGYFRDDLALPAQFDSVIDKLHGKSPAGGTPRYASDNYFRASEGYPNPWLISTLWTAQYYIRRNQYDDAQKLLRWVEERTLASGMMPEQVNPEDGSPKSVTPLVWSHAEYINTVLDLAHKQKNSSGEFLEGSLQ